MAERLPASFTRAAIALLLLALSAGSAAAAEETVYGILEKTTRPGACAQITDTLGEVYYVVKTDEAQKLIAVVVGRNIRVAITGVAERHEGDAAWYFNLKTMKRCEAPEKKAAEKKTAETKPSEAPAGEKEAQEK